MNGELASMVALCLHGSAWLGQSDSELPAPAPLIECQNSTFKYVKSVNIQGPPRRFRRPSVFPDVACWLQQLRDDGVDRIWLAEPEANARDQSPDPHVASAFIGGVRWALMTVGRRPALWYSTLTLSDPDAQDRRIWSMTLTGTPCDEAASPQRPDLAASREELCSALKQIQALAAENALDSWASMFAEALDALEAARPQFPFNSDIAPAGLLNLESAQLLAAAMKSWVFGGMGSWNDVSLRDDTAAQSAYELTAGLYGAVIQAITAVTNTSTLNPVPERKLSRAILAYVWGSPRRPWPSQNPDAVVAEFGLDAADLMPRIKQVFELLDGLEPAWGETLSEAADRVQAVVRSHHPELDTEANKAVGTCFAYGFR